MDFLEVFYRYCTGSNDGLVAKLSQHAGQYEPDGTDTSYEFDAV